MQPHLSLSPENGMTTAGWWAYAASVNQSKPLTPSIEHGNLVGMGLMLVAGIAFAGMHAAIRHIGETVHPFEIAFFRNLFGFLVLTPLLLRYGWAPLRARRAGLLSLRAVVNLAAMLAYFTALTLAPLADVAALGFSAPIFATLFAIPVMGAKVGWRRASAIGLGFLGAFIIVNPSFGTLGPGHGLVLISAVLWAWALLIIKHASRWDSSLTITLYMGIMMTPISLPFAMWVWTWPSVIDWGWLVAIGTMGGIAQWTLTEALKVGEVSVVMPFDFFRLIWAALFGYFFFSQVPSEATWIGGTLIFSAATYIAVRESRLTRRR